MSRKKIDKQAEKIMNASTNRFGKNFRKNISITGKDGTEMESFRMLGMGLEAQIHEGLNLNYTTITGDYDVVATDDLIACNGTLTVNLITAAKRIGKQFIIKNIGTGDITIDGFGSETIDGTTTIVMGGQYTSITTVSDGTNWMII